MAWLAIGLAACGTDAGSGDACAGVACSGHGECVARDNSASCICDTGFVQQGLTCVDGGGDSDSDSDSETDTGAQPADCDAFCSPAVACGIYDDSPQCTAHCGCLSSNWWRDDVAGPLFACFQYAPCDTSNFGNCTDPLVSDLEPSDAARDFILACEDRWGYDCFTSGPCARFGLLQDAALDAITDCLALDCAEGGACINDAYWGTGVDPVCGPY